MQTNHLDKATAGAAESELHISERAAVLLINTLDDLLVGLAWLALTSANDRMRHLRVI